MSGRTLIPSRMPDQDAVLSLWADISRLAIKDYLQGPGRGRQQDYYASAEAYLRQAGLLHRVHEKFGTPAHLGHECYMQAVLDFED